ncbi:MAG TPA: serine/threonine-protein kinase [Kofleriaceae bacterium]|nr:serine/threonine-protein kinase [Kofleriaceae bacterium]
MVDSDGPEAKTVATKTSAPATGPASPLEALVRDTRARAVSDARENGSAIGRFTIVDRLGRGGMGAVYRAYDPTLDRAVAIKMLHEGHDPQRLLREAQALARLQHPNVLTVHEAGVDGGHPYLATELVDGDNLADWLRAEPREREDILEVFAAAGRGLIAAHHAGIVHRDFKPANVLVGSDGRVRVADLGIARGDGAAPPHETTAVSSGHDDVTTGSATGKGRLLSTPLTVAGAIIGTPAYMAPEQAEGRTADARSDQFSFCISLWEALTGSRPFLRPYPERLQDIIKGVADAPKASTIPPPIRRALARGLSYEPDERFPSMEALLAALFPPPRVRLWIVAVAVAVLAAAAVALFFARGERAASCDVAAELDGAWDAKVRDAIGAAFAKAGPAYAAEGTRAQAALETYAHAWLDERVTVCRERATSAADRADRRRECLDRLQLELGALTRLVSAGDPAVLGRATSAVLALRAPSLCAHPDAFARRPTPADADGRARLARVETGLAELKALHDAARHRDGLARIDAVLADARALAAPALVAEVFLWRGKLLRQLDDYEPSLAAYRDGVREAEVAGADRLRFELTVRALDITGYFLEDRAQSAWLTEAALGVLGRLGNPADLAADLAESRSNAEMRFGRLDLAREQVELMLKLRTGVVAQDSPLWAKTLRSYARVTQNQGELDITDRYMRQALAIMERHLGPDHPDLGYYLNVIGILHKQRGELDEAERVFRRLLESDTRAYGPDNGKTGRTWNNLGGVLAERGKLPEALAAFERALAIHGTAVGPTSELYAGTATSIAGLLVQLGRLPEARARIDAALAIYAAHPDDRGAIGTLLVAARIEDAAGDRAAALAHASRAVALADGDTATPALAIDPLLVRAELLRDAGRRDDARRDAERALAILDAHPQSPARRAEAARLVGELAR